MRPAFVVSIQTPKRFLLDGLWFGPQKAKQVIVFVHGLTSSAFTMAHLLDELVDKDTAVLSFNNRGFKIVTDIKKIDASGKAVKWRLAGAAHEVFTECVDDIQGAVDFARTHGAKDIFLMGHSTGCQKSVYWAAKRGDGVKGLILLGPLSDYACQLDADTKGLLARGTSFAQKLVRTGKPHELLPQRLTVPYTLDAQRFLSLYTLDSAEEIFSYAQPKKVPRTLKTVKQPIRTFLAEEDEHSRRPASELAEWFRKHARAGSETVVIPGVHHSFKGAEKTLASDIKVFMKDTVQSNV